MCTAHFIILTRDDHKINPHLPSLICFFMGFFMDGEENAAYSSLPVKGAEN
jgi:hypothetical protein